MGGEGSEECSRTVASRDAGASPLADPQDNTFQIWATGIQRAGGQGSESGQNAGRMRLLHADRYRMRDVART